MKKLIVAPLIFSFFLIFMSSAIATSFVDNFDNANNWSNATDFGLWSFSTFQMASYEIAPAGVLHVITPYMGGYIHNTNTALDINPPFDFYIDTKYDTGQQETLLFGTNSSYPPAYGYKGQLIVAFWSDQVVFNGCGVSTGLLNYDFVSGNWYNIHLRFTTNSLQIYVNSALLDTETITNAEDCKSWTYVFLGGGNNDFRFDNLVWSEQKNVSLSVSPSSGTLSTIFDFQLTTNNLDTPFNVTYYMNSTFIATIYNLYNDTYVLKSNGGSSIGTWIWYAVVNDSSGYNTVTNSVPVIITGVGISPFTLNVTPTSANVTDIFTFTTSEIYGGNAPYTVTIYLNTTDIEVGGCRAVGEHEICRYADYLPSGNWYAFAIARDSVGNLKTSTAIPVSVSALPLGNPLNATLRLSPTSGDTTTIFTFTLSIQGGSPPYYVSWFDVTTPICSEERYDQEPPLTITEKYNFWAGSHSVQVTVRSADGQSAPSNSIDFNVAWAGQTINITAYDCRGTLGTNIASGSSSQAPLVDTGLLVGAGAGWLAPFFTPLFFSTIMLLGTSGLLSLATSKYVGGGQTSGIVFVVSAMILAIIYSILGIYPAWLTIALIIVASFLTAKFLIGVI